MLFLCQAAAIVNDCWFVRLLVGRTIGRADFLMSRLLLIQSLLLPSLLIFVCFVISFMFFSGEELVNLMVFGRAYSNAEHLWLLFF